jgi:nitrate reductase (NAD(P)H)
MVRLRDPATRESIIRSYTPISEVTATGHVDMLVKVYFSNKNTGNKGGKMSQAMDALPVGHFIEMKGPIGKFTYLGQGRCLIGGHEKGKHVKEFVMICGGSGITPIYQVFRAVMRDKDDPTHCVLFDGNRLLEDILCRTELEELLKGNEERATVLHTLTKAPDEWTGLRGRVTGDLVQKYAQADEDALVLICGPEAMEVSMRTALIERGWREEQLVFF